MAQLDREALNRLVYLTDGSALPNDCCWGAAACQVNTKADVRIGRSFDALEAFYEPDNEVVVDSAMVELIAAKLAVSPAKFYAKEKGLQFNEPLHIIIDNA